MGRQTSNKSGVKSTSQKLATSNEGFNPVPAAKPVADAFGDPTEDEYSAMDASFDHDTKRVNREKTSQQTRKRATRAKGKRQSGH